MASVSSVSGVSGSSSSSLSTARCAGTTRISSRHWRTPRAVRWRRPTPREIGPPSRRPSCRTFQLGGGLGKQAGVGPERRAEQRQGGGGNVPPVREFSQRRDPAVDQPRRISAHRSKRSRRTRSWCRRGRCSPPTPRSSAPVRFPRQPHRPPDRRLSRPEGSGCVAASDRVVTWPRPFWCRASPQRCHGHCRPLPALIGKKGDCMTFTQPMVVPTSSGNPGDTEIREADDGHAEQGRGRDRGGHVSVALGLVPTLTRVGQRQGL